MPDYKGTINIADSLLAELGSSSVRSQFGAYTIVIDGYTLVQSNERGLFVRLCKANWDALNPSDATQYKYRKKNHMVRTKYYLFENFESRKIAFVEAVTQAFDYAKRNEGIRRSVITELVDAPNLTQTHVNRLRSVGINNYDDLKRVGALEVAQRLKRASFKVTKKLGYCLQGAIEQCHWTIISAESKPQFDVFTINTD
ncbi:TfoX/Sxy family DNA transformation protein [Vibrio agarivorans]|uniref:TfoX/Sxy family DNA transformation protein n=1 Tax=Vibrio agarivorans TaxID=153622 RepID=UPI0025B50A9B|nr:TfoX/Sxy family DNA transformation protein [Vibrio agarivorans]MDN3661137.1 TfoX/Sxy family DNA transformation protein [Vibrio agarivorans]